MSGSKDVRIRGYLLKPEGIQDQKGLGNTDLVHACHLISWKSILILSSHLRLGLPSGFFSSSFPHQSSVFISPPYVPHGPRIPFLLILSAELYLMRRTDNSAHHCAVSSTTLLPGPSWAQIFSSNTLNLCSSLNVKDQVLYPCDTRGKSSVLYTLICIFGWQTGRQNILERTGAVIWILLILRVFENG